ncbi:hypothetical protein V2S66_31510 [Streptomyces sp. V4-01]|uniref:Uncharacterized protein n=1 Tax=Actinacidiphila polyblastidii TaxID=3110430 RepID=A0ABU7PKX2_9ACTN|nr:hypothetical protein [Streptomyces sp. V4-01]
MTDPRLFTLQRDHDITGVSGTGTVADGVLWPDNTVSIRWRGDRPSIVHWGALADAEHVHGHGGATRIVWRDAAAPAASCPAGLMPLDGGPVDRCIVDGAHEQHVSALGKRWTDDTED